MARRAALALTVVLHSDCVLGGFMEHDASRMSNNIASPGRARNNLVHTLRPTTVKQLLEATTKAGSDAFSIGDGAAEVDLGQVCSRPLCEAPFIDYTTHSLPGELGACFVVLIRPWGCR